jgi:TolB-like protein
MWSAARSRPAVRRAATAVAGFLLLAAPLRAQCPDGTPPPCRTTRPAAPPRLSIAVLDFENFSRDTNDAFLSSELAEELTSRLRQIERLTVVPRPVVRRVRNLETMTVPDIGRALNVSYIVTGSIRRAGGRLRITVDLLRAATGASTWSRQYDRFERDLLALQDALAADVAAGVAGRLLPAERTLLAARPTTSDEAYDAYLRGRAATSRATRQASLTEAITHLERAIALDTSFADAWASLSYAHSAMFVSYYDRSEARRELARAAAVRAVSLAPRRFMPQQMYGYYAYWVERDYERALVAFQTALALEPANAAAYNDLANVYQRRGDWVLSLETRARGIELDPGNAVPIGNRALTHRLLRRYDEARADYLRSLPLYRDSTYALQGLVELAAATGATPDSAFLSQLARRAEDFAQSFFGTGSLLSNWRMFPQLADAIAAARPDSTIVGRLNHYTALAEASLAQGRRAASLAASDSVRALAETLLRGASGEDVYGIHLALANARLGRCEEALQVGARAVVVLPLSSDAVLGPVLLQALAQVQVLCGRTEEALANLERLLAIPSYLTPELLRRDPAWAPLREHPRFQQLVHRTR